MAGKTIYIQSGQALTSEFRSAEFWNAPAEITLSGDIFESGAVLNTNTAPSLHSHNNYIQPSPFSIWVIAPFIGDGITRDIIQNIKSVLSCECSFILDPTELDKSVRTNDWSWNKSDCLLIIGNMKLSFSSFFQDVQTYLINGGRVVYWGDIAPDDSTQIELIGARMRGVLSDNSNNKIEAIPSDSLQKSLQLLDGMRKFRPYGKVPRFTSQAPDCQNLLFGKSGSTITSLAWTRNIGAGKLFYCGLSEESDWLCNDCMTLMLNAVRWGCEKD
ncbi:MAG: hypothetical protein IJQ39_00415 [Thermoguttaceae bacterium]|nr:hypothetical protein [Thermoguttaceae bacterium]